jgi:hypothetical protein
LAESTDRIAEADEWATAGSGRLEQLDRVTGRILQQDLLAAITAHDFVAELSTGGLESGDRSRQVLDFDSDAVPTAWCGVPTVRHGLAGPTGSRLVE